jgi:hypothetical protein
LYACKPEEAAYDVVPAIQLLSTQLVQTEAGTDSLILLTLSYTDGDGDVGLTDADTAAPFNFGSPFFHNLPVTYLVPNASGDYMELQDGNGEPYGNQHERIPVLTPPGKYKSISGTIQVKLTADPVTSNKPDSVMFSVALIDRALHVSNRIQTKVIQLKH